MAGVVVAECGGCAGYAGAGVGGGRDGAVGARRGATKRQKHNTIRQRITDKVELVAIGRKCGASWYGGMLWLLVHALQQKGGADRSKAFLRGVAAML